MPVYNFEVSGTHTYLVGERGCVVHNCHHLEGRLWRQAMTRADAGTKVGLSATIPEIAFSSLRTATKGTIWLIGATGPILFGLTPSDLIRDGWLCQPKITFLTPPELPWDLEGSFPVVYRAGIVENEGRNKLIAETAKREVRKKGNRVLITVRQRDHVLRLERALEAAGLSVVVVTGSTPGAKREALTSLVKRRERDVLLGTVFGEAVDLPFLETVIIADAGASPVLALQRLRNLTPVDEHDRPRRERMTPADVVPVYDFADLDHKILKRHSLARLKAYREHEEFMIRWVP